MLSFSSLCTPQPSSTNESPVTFRNIQTATAVAGRVSGGQEAVYRELVENIFHGV